MTADGYELPILFLKPGEMVIREEPMIVTTLLGSCVAVTMFSRRLQMGAICHAVLPTCRKDLPCSHSHTEAGKYVECAIRLMLEAFLARGVAKNDIEAKLFGGSDMFDTAARMQCQSQSVGKQNMAMALEMLQRHSVRVATQDMGGPRGRKIIFHTHTGEVFLKRLRKSEI